MKYLLYLSFIHLLFFKSLAAQNPKHLPLLNADYELIIDSVCYAKNLAEGYVYHLNTKTGLPSDEIYDSYEDSKGNMWFTTDRGIVQYNGTSIKIYTSLDGLANTVNFSFFGDAVSDTFWVCGLNNLYSYWDGNHFKPFEYNEELTEYASGNQLYSDIVFMDEQGFGFIYAPRRRNLLLNVYYYINTKTGQISQHEFKPYQKVDFRLNNLMKNLMTTRNDLQQLPDDDKKYHHDLFANERPFTAFFHQKSGLSTLELCPNFNYTYWDLDSNLWVIGSHGAYQFPKGKLKCSPKVFFKDIFLTSIRQGKSGGYWFTTIDKGVIYLSSLTVNRVYSENLDLTKTAFILTPTPDFLFVCRNFDVLIMDTLLSVKSYPIRAKNFKPTIVPENNGEFKVVIRNKYFDFRKEGFSFRNKTNTRKHFTTSKGKVIFYSDHLRTAESPFDTVFNEHVLFKRPHRVLQIKEDANQNLWFATFNGLSKGHIDQSAFEFCSDESFILPHRVTDIETDTNHTDTWISSLSQGLFFFHKDSIYSPDIDFFGHSIHSIHRQKDSILWIGTNHGLFKLRYRFTNRNLELLKLDHFTSHDGLISNYITDIVCWNGYIWLATNLGICRFDQNELKPNTNTPKIVLESIQISGKNYDQTDFPIILNHKQNDISIAYQGVSYKKPLFSKPFYRYKLGSSSREEWKYTDENQLNFNNLNTGIYTFRVQCRNQNDQWSSIVEIPFTIKIPIYKTSLFIVLFILAIVVLLSIGSISLLRIRQRKMKVQLSLKEAELHSLVNQTNPHFIFNTLNSIQNFVIKNDKHSAAEYLAKLSRLMRKSLSHTKVRYISLEEEISFVKEYLNLEKFRSNNLFEYEIELSSKIETDKVYLAALLTQPVIENAVKHAFNKTNSNNFIRIKYGVDERESYLQVMIEDNGSGIDSLSRNEQHKSYGLEIVKDRLSLMMRMKKHKGDSFRIETAKISRNLEKGTRITMMIPVNIKR